MSESWFEGVGLAESPFAEAESAVTDEVEALAGAWPAEVVGLPSSWPEDEEDSAGGAGLSLFLRTISGEDPPGLERMLQLPGRFDDPKRDPAIDKDGTRFDLFLGGRSRRNFASSWLAQRPGLAQAAREPMADLTAGDIAKAWFVIHDVGVKSSLGDRRFKAADKATKKGSVHGFLNRAGYYAATHDFSKDRKGTVYEFLSRKGKKIAGGTTINIETVPDIENGVADRADGSHGPPSDADRYASIGYRKAGTKKVNYYKWTNAAFDILADLYILASARAGHLLTITAHKEMDRNLGRSVIWREYSAVEIRQAVNKFLKNARDNPSDYHGDPFAFDVQALYDVITRKLNALGGAQMPPGARYGVHPLRLRTAGGADVGNGDGQLHEFPHQSDPRVNTDTKLKKPGWWAQGSKSEAEGFADEFFDEALWAGEGQEDGFGEAPGPAFDDSHAFVGEETETGLGGEAMAEAERPEPEAATPWSEGAFGEYLDENGLTPGPISTYAEDFEPEYFEPESLAETLDELEEVEAAIEHCAEDEALRDDEEERLDSGTWSETAEQIAFRKRVLAAHIERTARIKKMKGPQRDLRDDELAAIPGSKIQTRADTAAAVGRLLAAARADLIKARASGDADALRTHDINVDNAYRSGATQYASWMSKFKRYYNLSQAARARLTGGPHSAAAVNYMLNPEGPDGFGLPWRLAAPGFSAHQRGTAVDFSQDRPEKYRVSINTDMRERRKWRATWFHHWLTHHAAHFGFEPLKSEEWHWGYNPEISPGDRGVSGDEAVTQARAFLGGSIWTYASRACGSRVSVFVPAAAQGREKVDLMLYVHGLLGPCGAPPVLPEGLVSAAPFALGRIVAESARPMILVVPRFQPGDDKSWSPHRLDRPDAINALFAEVLAETGRRLNRAAPAIDQLIVAGHSRAFGILYPLARASASPELGKGALARLSRIWALDATYGTPPIAAFESLTKAKRGLEVEIIYRAKSDTDKFKGASRAGALALRPIPRSITHCAVPGRMLPALLAELSPPRPGALEAGSEAEDLWAETPGSGWSESGVTGTGWLEAEADALDRFDTSDSQTWDESHAFGPSGAFEGTSLESEDESPDRFDELGDARDSEWESDEAEAEADREAESGLASSGLSPAERIAVEITSTLETGKRGGFYGLSGNFDGQGLSFGLVNWTIGTGSLQPLLREFAAEHPARWATIFGRDAEGFLQLMSRKGELAEKEQHRFAVEQMNKVSVVGKRKKWEIKEPWAGYFLLLSEDPAFRGIQIRHVRILLKRAGEYCRQFRLKSEMAFAFMFDAVSSHGKSWLTKMIGGQRRRQILTVERLKALVAQYGVGRIPEREILLAIADVLGATSAPRWADKVRQRKRWFVTGEHPRARELEGLQPSPDKPWSAS
jgi:D-alanyl-D-alanine carboxypeptidase